MDCNSFQLYRVALGLATPPSLSEDNVTEATMAVLKRYGISPGDVNFSVNDDTNATLAASRQIYSGKQGGCMMHLLNLAGEHAIGKRIRKRQGEVVDSLNP